MSKVDYEVRECDCCHSLYHPVVGIYGNYELTRRGEVVDLCNNCKVNLINYVNEHIFTDETEKEEEEE